MVGGFVEQQQIRLGDERAGQQNAPPPASQDAIMQALKADKADWAGAIVPDVQTTFAGTILAALPLFILLLVFQKQLVRGLTAGAVKG